MPQSSDTATPFPTGALNHPGGSQAAPEQDAAKPRPGLKLPGDRINHLTVIAPPPYRLGLRFGDDGSIRAHCASFNGTARTTIR